MRQRKAVHFPTGNVDRLVKSCVFAIYVAYQPNVTLVNFFDWLIGYN